MKPNILDIFDIRETRETNRTIHMPSNGSRGGYSQGKNDYNDKK